MEITSRFVEHSDLGQLHVVRFAPEDALPNEHAAVFNSFKGRVTTIDGFAVPFMYAALKNVVTDYIERPHTGSSSSIEDRRMRKNYRKHGYIEISDAVVEALEADDPNLYGQAEHLHAGGFSLGGNAGSMYLRSVGVKAASGTFEDPAGYCDVDHTVGSLRFFGYLLGVETPSKLLKIAPGVEPFFDEYRTAFDVFMQELFASDARHHEPPQRTKRDTLMEFHEVTMPTQGEALRAIDAVMRGAAQDERKFELRASFSPMRWMTDHRSIRETNEVVDRLDRDFPDQKTVSYGFLQHDGMLFWHDFAKIPEYVRKLITTPVTDLRRRLSYFR